MTSRTGVSSLDRVGLYDGQPHCQISWDQAVVLSVARGIEPNPEKALQWYLTQPIAEFGGKTARQLVEGGATAPLLDMLVAVRRGHRGA